MGHDQSVLDLDGLDPSLLFMIEIAKITSSGGWEYLFATFQMLIKT